jgi:hypothetical protein
MDNHGGEDVVEEATRTLTTLLHCRKQAEALATCRLHGMQGPGCEREHSAYITCANEHLSRIINFAKS